jgi:transcriptional regulator with XRE-family HTH domain
VQDNDVTMQPVPYGEILAANVRAQRARTGLTQQALAKRMRQLGARWHFQTVGAVERSERPLSAYEVPALAFALWTTPDVLMLPPPDVQLVAFGDQPVPYQRLSIIDDSVNWDGDDIKVTPPTVQYRPGEMRAVVDTMREMLRRGVSGEPPQGEEEAWTAENTPVRRPSKPGKRRSR